MACFRGNREEFYGEILLLDETTLTLTSEGGFGKRTKAAAVLQQVCSHLSLVQVRFFGLRFCDNKQETHWLDPLKTLQQHRDLLGPPYIFYFGVKFYSEDPSKLTDEAARYQFFLQVRQDVRRGRLPCPAHLKPRLSALMMLSERDERSDAERRQQDPEVQKISSVSRPLAQGHFLSLCSSLQLFGVFLFAVYGENQTEYFVGPSPVGLAIYRSKSLVGKYVWQKITKIHFKNETFELRVIRKNGSETSFFFQTADRSDCKRLWKCCVEHHKFRLSESSEFQHKQKYNSLTLPRLNVAMWKNKSGILRTADVFSQAEHVSSEAVRVQTAPPAVRRLDRAERECLKPGAPWEISGSFSGLFNPKFPPNIKESKDQHESGSMQSRSRSLDGDRPIRERPRRSGSHGNTSSGGESERVSSERCRRRRRKHGCHQGGRSPNTTCRCRARSRSPDAVTWTHIQKQLVEPDGLIDRKTEEIPFKEVRVPRSHRGGQRHRWTSATDLESKMDVVPPLPVTTTTDTSCGLPTKPLCVQQLQDFEMK